jgi:hypothetical protein
LDPIPVEELVIEHETGLYDGYDPDTRRKLSNRELRNKALLDDEGQEIPIYDENSVQIPRRLVVEDTAKPPCGVLVDLKKIQGLFNPDISATIPDDSEIISNHCYEDPTIRVEAYPLAFLKTAGNIKASGVPHCFYPLLTEINNSVRIDPEDLNPDIEEDGDGEQNGQGRAAPKQTFAPHLEPTYRAVKPVSSQFYNYMTHRVASRAGRHDSQQASVTAAISGGYANNASDQKKAEDKQKYCNNGLPSERFHNRINTVRHCPRSCRAELVYSVDVRALQDPRG